MMQAMAVLQVVTGELATDIQRIAWAQIIMAGSMVLVGLAALVALVLSLRTLRAMARLIHSVERTVERLTPQVELLSHRANDVARDAAGVSVSFRKEMEGIVETVEELHGKVKQAAEVAEDRVRHFGDVLDVVQGETEALLMDAAAAAHGVHRTARALRGEGRRPRRPRRSE
jgi:uncharacterized protein YoxC